MLLRVSNLTAERNHFLLFKNLSLQICSGQNLLILGANGVGKSTLLKILAGLYLNYKGSFDIYFKNKKIEPSSQIGYLAHQDAMNASLTVYENLSFWKNFLSTSSNLTPSIDAILERDGLYYLRDFPFGSLSSGQQRRIGIARLQLSKKLIWLLDEPLTSLDSNATIRFIQRLKQHNAVGGMSLIATHSFLNIEGIHVLKLDANQ